jgi:hypothetical protein
VFQEFPVEFDMEFHGLAAVELILEFSVEFHRIFPGLVSVEFHKEFHSAVSDFLDTANNCISENGMT